MPAFERLMFKALAVIAVFVVLSSIFQLSGPNVRTKISKIPIPGLSKVQPEDQLPAEKLVRALNLTKTCKKYGSAVLMLSSQPPKVHPNPEDLAFDNSEESVDMHPISILMMEADERWTAYNEGLSTTFKTTVAKYRRDHGRHPPPGFKEVS